MRRRKTWASVSGRRGEIVIPRSRCESPVQYSWKESHCETILTEIKRHLRLHSEVGVGRRCWASVLDHNPSNLHFDKITMSDMNLLAERTRVKTKTFFRAEDVRLSSRPILNDDG